MSFQFAGERNLPRVRTPSLRPQASSPASSDGVSPHGPIHEERPDSRPPQPRQPAVTLASLAREERREVGQRDDRPIPHPVLTAKPGRMKRQREQCALGHRREVCAPLGKNKFGSGTADKNSNRRIWRHRGSWRKKPPARNCCDWRRVRRRSPRSAFHPTHPRERHLGLERRDHPRWRAGSRSS